ncbi:MAG TPA: YiiX/YebB-like N1pC/P60 family cysteine hydrolase [Bacteroidia bacterium]|nr:YiiX/YebB-like N1pC/P60 family cysteine hydrolase [Bacteroidia bacterium]
MKKVVAILMLSLVCGLLFHPLKSATKITTTQDSAFSSIGFKTGDLVFRQGKGLVSELFRKTSKRDPRFSHAGVLVIENNVPFVFHVIGSEENAGPAFRKELLSHFCSKSSINSYAVYRNSLLTNREIPVRNYLNNLSNSHIVFDEQFNLDSDSQLYCSEMIYKLIRQVSGKSIPLSSYNGDEYVALDDLYFDAEYNQLLTFHKY